MPENVPPAEHLERLTLEELHETARRPAGAAHSTN